MKFDKLSSILGSGPGDGGADDAPDAPEPDERLHSAEAILRAIRKDDAAQLDMALEDHYKACESRDSGEETSEEE